MRAGWGDEEADEGALNPNYDPDQYADYSAFVRRNIARLDETRLDLDLLEMLIRYVDDTSGPGAILVFLPGDLMKGV